MAKQNSKKKSKKTDNINVEAKLLETEIYVLVDKSFSMNRIAQATVEGFNTFIEEQKRAEGKAFVTQIQFDDRYEVIYKSIPVAEVTPLIVGETYIPRGNTALYDAIGKTINEMDTTRDVVFVIITDGEENASKEYKNGQAIKKMIETLENEKQWKFVYMGANQDAILVGSQFGIKSSNAMTYAADNINVAFQSFSSNISTMRSAKANFYSKVATGAETYTASAMGAFEDDLGFSADQRTDSLK